MIIGPYAVEDLAELEFEPSCHFCDRAAAWIVDWHGCNLILECDPCWREQNANDTVCFGSGVECAYCSRKFISLQDWMQSRPL